MDWLSRNLWSLVHELALVQGSSRPPPLNPGFTTTFSMACSAFYSNHEIVGATRTNLNKIKSVMPVSCLPGASAQALPHSLFEGIQDGHVEVREITFVPSGHGEAMNARRGGHHSVLT